MFLDPTNTVLILDLKGYLFYQHQKITIMIKGERETCLIPEIAIIIFSLNFIGSFEATAISFKLVFPA